MVKLMEDVTGSVCLRAKANGEKGQVEIDMQQVGQVRELLRQEYQANREKYGPSEYYHELMDPNSAHTCWRYLKEVGGDLEAALELMKRSIVWRVENEVDGDIDNTKVIKDFFLFAPTYFSGKTKDGHDIFYVIGRDYQKPDAKFRKQVIRFVRNMLLSWDRRNRYNQDQLTIVFDVTDTGYRNLDLDFMSWLVGIIDYLPARFHHIYVVGIPFLIRPLVRLIISWLPAKFSTRVYCGTFEDLVELNIGPESLPDRAGGSAPDSIRLAPREAPWLEQSPEMSQPKMEAAMEYCICANLSLERRAELRQMQRDFERQFNE